MGSWYVPEIFVPSEKRILSPSFHDGYFVPPSGFLPAAAPTRKMPVRNLCHISVWYRIQFMRSFAMCRLLFNAVERPKKAACTIFSFLFFLYIPIRSVSLLNRKSLSCPSRRHNKNR